MECWKNTSHNIAKATPPIGFGLRIENDDYKTRLEDPIEFTMAEIRRVGRDLGRNAPSKKSSPHMYIYIAWKFNVTNNALISSIDERGL